MSDLASLITAIATLVTSVGGVLAILLNQRATTRRAIEAQQQEQEQGDELLQKRLAELEQRFRDGNGGTGGGAA